MKRQMLKLEALDLLINIDHIEDKGARRFLMFLFLTLICSDRQEHEKRIILDLRITKTGNDDETP